MRKLNTLQLKQKYINKKFKISKSIIQHKNKIGKKKFYNGKLSINNFRKYDILVSNHAKIECKTFHLFPS